MNWPLGPSALLMLLIYPAMDVKRQTRLKTSRLRAFTLVELIVIVAVAVLLLLMVVPAISRQKDRSHRITCANNLKQIGMAFKTFGLDSNDQFPMYVEAKHGGSLEALSTGEVFRHFLAISNELSTPKILVCPADTRPPASNFFGLANANLSYFIGMDANDSTPAMFLTGDRNLTNGTVLPPDHILIVTSNNPVNWNHELHRFMGNVGLSDGSVQGFTRSKLNEALWNSGVTNRLAIP
jgi:competence protein ComGC